MTSSELITATQFLDTMRREARFYRLPSVENALGKIVDEIERGPALAQARLLTRILIALAKREGSFRHADVTLLSTSTLGMLDSMLEGHAMGRISQEDCDKAANRVIEAQRVAEA